MPNVPIDDEIIEFHSDEMDLAAQHLVARANAVEAAMRQLSQSLNPMRQTWVQSPSKAGHAVGVSERELGKSVDHVVSVIRRFSGQVVEASAEQVKLDSTLATYVA